MDWRNIETIYSRSYVCGHCSNRVGSNKGYYTNNNSPEILSVHVCPHCSLPSVFQGETQYPGVLPGGLVSHLPTDIESLYNEARSAFAAGAFTAAVLACRKLLMNIAVAQGAPAGLAFIAYVQHLSDAGYIPPNGKAWVDHIRKRGNEATHEISLMSDDDAQELILFSEMLLRFIFEFPKRVPSPK
ncbi:uncharacterized protein DUF4145 [Nitrosomonas oligotropha]|uniref:Uncharacterized protein DUF4145 n=1 Tax=Nitrosomonas oligotropha TaxID=42354 RepID=A0A2T5HCP9_9PROT|nr:DUF4145 domain-containing protein [Nitrosomonas oligotropha]PTQ69347.1 uncharacterized protein DUF4145 [Nitrosomonas oligotropha]